MNQRMNFKEIFVFEGSLKIGDPVEIRWTAGSFGHYASAAVVTKINAGSIRAKISAPVMGKSWKDGSIVEVYPMGREIVVPRVMNVASNNMPKTWASFNCVAPLSEPVKS